MNAVIAKSDRIRFGKTGKPIQATKAYFRPLPGFQDTPEARSWILINEKADTVTYVNTYKGGSPGKDFDAGASTYLRSTVDEKDLVKKLKDYTQVAINECPIATEATEDGEVEVIDPQTRERSVVGV